MSSISLAEPSAIGFPGGVPSWPGSDALVPDTFKFVVASWRRLNPDSTPTNDFVCDVGSYVPKAPFVRRISLVDVHVPNMQRTIEEPWSRLYFGQGIRTTPSWRTFQVEWYRQSPGGLLTGTVGSGGTAAAVTVVLPLPITPVVGVVALGPGVTRVVLAREAPRPIAVMASLAGPMALIGIPNTPPVVLTSTTVRDAPDAGPNAFDVISEALADAVAASEGDLPCMALASTVIPSDAALAKVLSCATTVALNTAAAACGAPCDATDGSRWRFTLQYCGGVGTDEFTVSYSPGGQLGGKNAADGAGIFGPTSAVPSTGFGGASGCGPDLCGAPVSFRIVSGPVAAYMGFDSRALPPGVVNRAPSGRVQPPCGFAQLTPGKFLVPADLAAAVTTAASAYSWPSFSLTLEWPPRPPVVVAFPGGQATLQEVAVLLQNAINATDVVDAAIQVFVLGNEQDACGRPTCDAPPVAPGSGAAGPLCCGSGGGGRYNDTAPGASPGPRGLGFASVAVPPTAFSISFPAAPSPVATFLGYAPGTVTATLPTHLPTPGFGSHIPAWTPCGGSLGGEAVLPVANVVATITPSGALALTSTPFVYTQPVDVTRECPDTEAGAALTVSIESPEALGLSPGMQVALVVEEEEGPQVQFVVLRSTLKTAWLVQVDGTQTSVPTVSSCRLLSLTTAPLSLYLQTQGGRVTRTASVPPPIFGFGPETYTVDLGDVGAGTVTFVDDVGVTRTVCGAPTVITSPGLVRVGHDPYLLLCLGFSAADTQGLTGDIYYPTQIPAGSSTLVFAPILRSACDWRPEYDRNFFKAFPGAGVHLGYIRVRILNADGRPYITHGHPVTVMLRAEVQTDTPQMGGPGHMIPIPQQCLPGAAMPYHPGGHPGQAQAYQAQPYQAQPYQTQNQNQTQGQTQEAAAAAAAATPMTMYPQFPGLWPMSNPGFPKY
jgi:hypothetical protein